LDQRWVPLPTSPGHPGESERLAIKVEQGVDLWGQFSFHEMCHIWLILLSNAGHRYEIHPQPEMPSVDMEFHLQQWLEFLHIFIYGGKLQGDDHTVAILMFY